jgi:hypothetical protein
LLTICFFIGLAPLFLFNTETWDGVIVVYGFEAGDLSGFWDLMASQHGYLSYFFSYLVYEIWQYTGISYFLIFDIIALVSITATAREIYFLARSTAGLEVEDCIFSAAIFFIFPAFHVLTVNLILFYMIYFWLLLFGYRKFKEAQTHVDYVVGIVAIVLSFQWPSSFSLLIGLAIADVAAVWSRTGRTARSDLLRLISILLASVCLFCIKLVLLRPYGDYSGYNKIILPTDWQNLRRTILGAWQFATYAAYLGVPLIITLVLWSCAKFVPNIRAANGRPRTLDVQRFWRPFIPICIWFLFSAAPYIAVQKSPKMLGGVDERHAIMLALPLSIGIAHIAGIFPNLSGRLNALLSVFLVRVGTLGVLSLVLILGYSTKVNQAMYVESMTKALRTISMPPPGILHINSQNSPPVHPVFYELQWNLYNAYGRAQWFATMTSASSGGLIPDDTEGVLVPSPRQKKLHLAYVMKDFEAGCYSEITLTGEKPGGIRRWLWLLGLVKPQESVAAITAVDCTRK